jgi:hypothetical protein
VNAHDALELTNTTILRVVAPTPEQLAQAALTAAWDAQDREDIRQQQVAA